MTPTQEISIRFREIGAVLHDSDRPDLADWLQSLREALDEIEAPPALPRAAMGGLVRTIDIIAEARRLQAL